MNKLTDNKFLIRRNYFDQRLSVNDFIFGGCVAKKCVSAEKLRTELRNLTAALGFDIHLSGYDYLVGLTVLYLSSDAYREKDCIARIADHYRVSTNNVIANVTEIISINCEFLPTASYLLNTHITEEDCTYISDAVELIAALFKIYYNYVVDETEDPVDVYDKSINFYRSFKNANR